MVTLKKDGYETKSYTIQIDKEKTNVTYSFPALVPVQKPDESEGGNSGEADTGGEGTTGDEGNDSGGGSSDAKPEEVTGGEP